MDKHEFIIQYWNQVATQNEEELKKYFYEDACIRWHDSNEEFNVEEFIRANCEYPGKWCGEVERFEQIENLIITVTRVWSSDSSFHVTSFFKMKDDKIEVLDEYWGEDSLVPRWRLDKHIGKPIK